MRLLILVASLLIVPASATAQFKVGVVDLRKAINRVEAGRRARYRLKSRKKLYQKQLDSAQKALKKAKEAYDRKKLIIRPGTPAMQKLKLGLQKKVLGLQRLYSGLTRRLAKSEAKETARILKGMQRILVGLARKYRLTMVVERNEGGVLLYFGKMDLTDELVRAYDSGRSKGKKTKPQRKKKRRPRRKKRRR